MPKTLRALSKLRFKTECNCRPVFRDQLVIGYFHAVRCSVANDSETQVCFRGGSVTASQGKDRYALAYYMQQAWLGLCTDIGGLLCCLLLYRAGV